MIYDMAYYQSYRPIAKCVIVTLSSTLSKSLVSTKLLNLEQFSNYITPLLYNVLCYGQLSEHKLHNKGRSLLL